MQIQALKTLVDGNTTLPKGARVEMDDWKAKELIALGYVVHIPDPVEAVAAPQNGGDTPFEKPLAGGLDGSAKPASLSPAGQARPKRAYKKRGAAAG